MKTRLTSDVSWFCIHTINTGFPPLSLCLSLSLSLSLSFDGVMACLLLSRLELLRKLCVAEREGCACFFFCFHHNYFQNNARVSALVWYTMLPGNAYEICHSSRDDIHVVLRQSSVSGAECLYRRVQYRTELSYIPIMYSKFELIFLCFLTSRRKTPICSVKSKITRIGLQLEISSVMYINQWL